MKEKYQQIQKITANIHGWLTKREGITLYETVCSLTQEGPVVEIGSWQGKSTVWMGKAIQDSERWRKLYAVDPHTGAPEQQERHGEVWTFPEFQENIKENGLEEVVEPLVMTSEEAVEKVKESPAFVFIDGAHEYEMVLLDFNLWSKKISNGGKIAFHDTNGRPGPTRVVREEVYFSRHFKDVFWHDSVTVATKVDSISFLDWIKKLTKLFYREVSITFSHRIKRFLKMLQWHLYRRWK